MKENDDSEARASRGRVRFARWRGRFNRRATQCVGRPLVAAAFTALAGIWFGGMAGAADAPRLIARASISAPAAFDGVCARYPWACARAAGGTVAGSAVLALARDVNRAVNRRVREVSDLRQYGSSDVWALPTATGGDCEDFALLKKKELVQRGVAPQNLLIATVLDRRGDPHAVLVLRTSQGDFVLDNLSSRIVSWRQTGYTFLRMQDPKAPHRWNAVFSGGIMKLAGS